MSYTFTISPDINAGYLPSWFVFNTWLQKKLGENIHLELYNDFTAQHKALLHNTVDLIYINPCYVSKLVRQLGFKVIAVPSQKFVEAVMVTTADSDIQTIENLSAETKLASTYEQDIHMICMTLLEPANLNSDNIRLCQYKSYTAVAKSLLQDSADVGFFLEDVFDSFSGLTQKKLRVLMRSKIGVLHHSLLVGPNLAHKAEEIQDALLSMPDHSKGGGVLQDLGFKCWEKIEQEEIEFMIDVIDTLIDE